MHEGGDIEAKCKKTDYVHRIGYCSIGDVQLTHLLNLEFDGFSLRGDRVCAVSTISTATLYLLWCSPLYLRRCN